MGVESITKATVLICTREVSRVTGTDVAPISIGTHMLTLMAVVRAALINI